MNPDFVTFTGLDARTDLDRAAALALRYPIEWGVLFGGKPWKPRYPDAETVTRITATKSLRLAAHLCGPYAQAVLGGRPAGLDLDRFDRIQVNAVSYATGRLALEALGNHTVIFQHREGPFPDETWNGPFYLHDCSGGKGVVPDQRPVGPYGRLVGYAGGINPENVTSILSEIQADKFWIDMETGVRTDDWLDLDKCEAVCRAIWGDR